MKISSLADARGRVVRYLRLSITDRCNLRCLYCRSDARLHDIPHGHILRYEELLRLVRLAVARGVEKVRLTGGEPFARKGCMEFLGMLRAEFPQVDLRVTTNGTLLGGQAAALARMGVNAVNLSLDTFDAALFARITGRDMLPQVLTVLDDLVTAGIRVKINAVAMRGMNEGDLPEFLRLARDMPVDVRFIEFMPMGSETCWSPAYFWPASDILKKAGALAELTPDAHAQADSGPARMFTVAGGRGRFGVISPLSNHFCAACNRLRVTPDGHLRTCLYADKEYRLRGLLRHPLLGDAAVARVMELACHEKPLGVELLRARGAGAVASKGMSRIGG